jgi:hypothetical protein
VDLQVAWCFALAALVSQPQVRLRSDREMERKQAMYSYPLATVLEPTVVM